jgi:hypothetical protein
MKDYVAEYEYHRKIDAAQARQQLQNCALLVAYVYGQASGWYGIASGHIDGFQSDYAIIHVNPGDFAMHRIHAFYLAGTEEEYMVELEVIRQACAEENESELPLVATLTPEEIQHAVEAVRAAWSESEEEDAEEWLRELCESSSASFVTHCDWAAAAEPVSRP